MAAEIVSSQDILDFWFTEPALSHWFSATPELDVEIGRRFASTWQVACAGGLADWEMTPDGALALVILLDQLPLNMYRGQAGSFATEAQARAVAERAIARGWDRALTAEGRAFLYMPFMHSESLADQDRAVSLFEAAGLMHNAKWARHHREIVRRFGRFPHRNAIQGRESTPAERDWLLSEEAFKG
jgi:uncharacterized protein (DUF924 family)